jgi:hypothetical protein
MPPFGRSFINSTNSIGPSMLDTNSIGPSITFIPLLKKGEQWQKEKNVQRRS